MLEMFLEEVLLRRLWIENNRFGLHSGCPQVQAGREGLASWEDFTFTVCAIFPDLEINVEHFFQELKLFSFSEN